MPVIINNWLLTQGAGPNPVLLTPGQSPWEGPLGTGVLSDVD